MITVKAYEEVIDFIATGTTPQNVIDFHPSEEAQERVTDLLSREKEGALSLEEKSELDHYLQLEHLMRLAKARARDKAMAEESRPLNSSERHSLRIAERPERTSVQRLIDLTTSLLREAETLAGDKARADESQRLQAVNFSEGIDFYAEVKQFETSLIRLALARTGGHQARAAKLLNIKPATLNSKIKLYGIES